MFKKIIFVFAAFLISFPTGAVFAEGAPKELQLYFSGGDYINFSKHDDLNDRLKKNKLEEVSTKKNNLSSGGGIRFFYDKFMVGLSGTKYGRENKTKGDYKISYCESIGTLDLGYTLFQYETFKIFPMIGAGAYNVTYTIYKKSSPGFDSMLSSPERGSTMSGSGFMLKAGIGVQYVYKLLDWGGVLIGAEASYNKSFFATHWQEVRMLEDSGGREVKNGPKYGLAGVDLKVNLGWSFMF